MGALAGLSSRAIVGTFYRTLEGEFDKSWANSIGMRFNSDQESETYRWLGATPAFREWIGGRQAKGLREDGLTIVNKKFEDTLEVDADDKRRDKTGQIKLRISEMAGRANELWDSMLSTLIANGSGSTSGLCYDGKCFFGTDHSEGSSGSQTNALTASNVAALNVLTPTAPTSGEMADAILGIIGHMLCLLDDRGEPINGSARQFAAMVGTPHLWGPVLTAATKQTIITLAGSIKENPLLCTDFKVTPIFNPRLSADVNKVRVFRTDGRVKPFILQENMPAKMEQIAEGSEEEIKNGRHLYCATAVRNVGYGMWQYAAEGALS